MIAETVTIPAQEYRNYLALAAKLREYYINIGEWEHYSQLHNSYRSNFGDRPWKLPAEFLREINSLLKAIGDKQ